MAKIRPPEEYATHLFMIGMAGCGAWIAVVFLFIL